MSALITLTFVIGTSVLLYAWARLTNPFDTPWFFTYTGITQPIKVSRNPLLVALAYIKCGIHILEYSLFRRACVQGTTATEIAQNILNIRFDANAPYLIAGDHFPVHYPRNIGIFYAPAYAMPQAHSILSRTLDLNLEVLHQTGTLYTTIVPVWKGVVVPIQIYAYPIDTLYSILYALLHLKKRVITKVHVSLLQTTLQSFIDTVFDSKSELVRTDRYFSGVKDITKRKSAFADNVMLWATLTLAQECGLKQTIDLEKLRQRILTTFWQPKEKYFREDLSESGSGYSSDWLTAYVTGFLQVDNPRDLSYLQDCVVYVRKNRIADPIPLRYHRENHGSRQHGPVRLFLPEYGGSAIWSYWGMQYCKLLLELARCTGDLSLSSDAQYYLSRYETIMIANGAFPETLTDTMQPLHTPFYRSIMVCGWVVNYLTCTAEKT